MRIKVVKLENIRSHVKSTVTFAKGFNCLVGGLGCGKSSVLYAIDFALFGDPLGRSYQYLLREGADTGKVELQFAHGGKTYRVVRGLKRHGKNIGQDTEQLKLFEEGNLIASVKSDAVSEQLKAITGLDKEIFREIVWVRQEHLKELLNMRPRERQKRLDELFGLSDYEVAWSNLAGFQREYNGEKQAYERDYDVVGMEKLQADYNQNVEELASIEAELQELRKRVVDAEILLNEANSKLQSLEELRKKTEELRQKEAQLQVNLVNIEDACAKLAENIQQKKVLLQELEQHLKELEEKTESQRNELQKLALKPNQTIEELKKYFSTLDEQMTSIRGEREATLREMQTSQKRLSSLTAENQCPLCLQPLSKDYKTNLLARLQRENAEREGRLAELQRNLKELEKIREIVGSVLSNLQLFLPRIEDLKNRIKQEQISLNELSTEFEAKQREEQEFRAELQEIRMEISKFDVTELELARRKRDSAFEQYSNLKSRLEIVETRKKEVGLRINELKERLDRAQQKLERMKKIGKLLEVIEGIRSAYRSIQPRLRTEFVKILERAIQHFLDDLAGEEGPALTVKIDETYTPSIRSLEGYERDVSNLSGGERTLLAFSYRLGLGQLIMQSRTGHGLYMLILDEPTESLGREDGSIDRLAEAISRLKTIEQIIAVTHSEAFAEKAEHVIRLEKEADVSKVFVENRFKST